MKKKLIEVLETFGVPVFLQGSMNPEEEFPESFLTFWTDSTEDGSHYDNDVHSYDWNFTVILYSNSPAIVNTKPDEIRTAMKAAGFIPQGKGQDIASGIETHTGWAMDFTYHEKN